MEESFTPLASLAGGMLIGLAASLAWLARGRIAGISGIIGTALESPARSGGSLAFLLGLIAAGAVAAQLSPEGFGAAPPREASVLAAAGLLVGFGTRLGGGCTSGHGICGLARLRVRSLVATLAFMLAGGLTVWLWGAS